MTPYRLAIIQPMFWGSLSREIWLLVPCRWRQQASMNCQ